MLPKDIASYTKTTFQPYYTDAEHIRDLMLELLGNVEGAKVLEPCAGQGAFIKGLHGIPKQVDAVDIDERHITQLTQLPKYVNPIHADFIDHFVSDRSSKKTSFITGQYDALICNPPYGLSFSVDYRKYIKKRLPKAYVRESYGLFMHFGIESLRPDGRYVFIVPDTFLTSRNHRPLRKFILDHGNPSHIIRFPSRLFGTVNFGYGHLCIIAGNRGELKQDANVIWSETYDSKATLAHGFEHPEKLSGAYLAEHCENGWIHPMHHTAVSFKRKTVQLGDIADCKTGIYTGNNERFCAFDSNRPPTRRANGHSIDWKSSVHNGPLTKCEVMNGIDDQKRVYVSFVRGGHRKPLEETCWAINWSKSAVDTYRTDKKARLQNHLYYFKDGLAIPMVTSGRLSASYMTNSVFDQGVVGIFPHDDALIPFLLIYLNNEQISGRAKSAINSGANNSANYVKRIPVIVPTEDELTRARKIFELAKLKGWEETVVERNALISSLVN